jgi:hypothetical protein
VGVVVWRCYDARMTKQAEVVAFPGWSAESAVGGSNSREALDARRLELVLASIRADAREHALHYRDDTVVPEGGE